MCLILFAYKLRPDYPLVLIANRDEFYARSTAPAHWWPDCQKLLAGKDLEAGGTWLGIDRSGRLAAVTNVREAQADTSNKISRGLLPLNYLQSETSPQQFASHLEQHRDDYRGYNLLFGDHNQLYYYSNRAALPQQLTPGLYGLSNATLNTPWPKVERSKESLAKQLQQPQLNPEHLLTLLGDTSLAPDRQLPATGVSLEWERRLSAIRIIGPEYGTRSSTALLIDRAQRIQFCEKVLAPDEQPTTCFEFMAN